MSTQTTMAGQDPKDKGRARTDINEARKEALDAAKQKSTFKWNPVHVRKRNVVAEGKHGLHWVCKLCGQTKAGDKSKFVAHILGPTTVGGTKHYYRNQRMDETWCYAYQDVKLLCDDLNEIKDNDSEFWTASGQKSLVDTLAQAEALLKQWDKEKELRQRTLAKTCQEHVRQSSSR